MTHADIVARLTAATGPDREIDAAITIITGDGPGEGWELIKQDQPGVFKMDAGCWIRGNLIRTPRSFTASLDAATALIERVLPGWCWDGGSFSQSMTLFPPDFQVNGSGSSIEISAEHPVPALALLLALFRALEAQEAV